MTITPPLLANVTDSLLQFGGRLHPLVLHVPIGLVVGLVCLELFAILRRKPLDNATRASFAWLVALTAVAATGSGLLLSSEDGYSGGTLDNHKLLGIAVAAGAFLTALCSHSPGLRKAYTCLLLATGALLVPAGHLGASMTHGESFLMAPFRSHTATLPVDGPSTDAGIYSTQIAPLLAERCASCHGATKHKGGLSLHTADAIQAGGDTGDTVVPGDAATSELVLRLRLPLDDEDHMPPRSKPQLTEAQISLIEQWIDAGAPFDGGVPRPAEPSSSNAPAAPVRVDMPPPAAMEALAAAQVHAEFIDPEAGLLWIDFAGSPQTDDASAKSLLAPLIPFVAELSLSGTRVTDETLVLAGEMKNLRALDLSGTGCTTEGLSHLGPLEHLAELRLTRTHLGESAVPVLSALKPLRRIFLWNSGISAESADALRAANPELTIDTGIPLAAAALETEGEIKLSSEAPLPGAPAAAASLVPVNSTCPVSGAALNPRYSIVHEGRVIGFCCEKCGAKFWESPDKYPIPK